jgi:hypothetical protein
MGGSGRGVGFPFLHEFFCCGFRVRGGGKCPEEEHTTCSGGPTILVTSAVYGEREKRREIKYSLKKRIFYYKKL